MIKILKILSYFILFCYCFFPLKISNIGKSVTDVLLNMRVLIKYLLFYDFNKRNKRKWNGMVLKIFEKQKEKKNSFLVKTLIAMANN